MARSSTGPTAARKEYGLGSQRARCSWHHRVDCYAASILLDLGAADGYAHARVRSEVRRRRQRESECASPKEGGKSNRRFCTPEHTALTAHTHTLDWGRTRSTGTVASASAQCGQRRWQTTTMQSMNSTLLN